MKFVKSNKPLRSCEKIYRKLEVVLKTNAGIGNDKRIAKQNYPAFTVQIVKQHDRLRCRQVNHGSGRTA